MSELDVSLDPTDRQELEQLVVEWGWLLDHGRAQDVPELLTEDGVFLGFPEPLVGREGMRTWADQRAANADRHTHHQVTNLRFQPIDADRVDGHCSIVLRVVDASGGPREEFVGEYVDEFRRTAEGWRFQKRTLRALGAS